MTDKSSNSTERKPAITVLQSNRLFSTLMVLLLLGVAPLSFANIPNHTAIPGSVGVNGSVSHERSRETVLTTLTGGNVDINVEEDTTLTGATIAAINTSGNDDAQGCANVAGAGCAGATTGNLSLQTGTLQVNALSNTSTGTSTSANVGMGSTVSIDASSDSSHSKTKTLGTIGEGTIQVANIEESDTKLLNRDVTDNTVDIYDIESHKGLKGSLDTRFLTEQGRDQIAEDVMKSGMIVDTLKLIVTTDKVGIEDFFSETNKSHTTYETVKETIAKDPNLAAMLQDPNLSAQEKEAMLNSVTAAVMEKLGYTAQDNKIVAEDDGLAGYYDRDSNTAYINDQNNDSTGELVTTAGHEMAHAMDNQTDGANEQYSQADRETYADNYGSNFASYTDMALDINGYDDGMAGSNSHSGNDSAYVQANNQQYNELDKSKGDNFCGTGLCIGAVALATYLLSGSKDAHAPGADEIPTESETTFPTDLLEEAVFNKLEAETGVPAIVLMGLDPKMLAKKGIKNADELVEAIRRGDVDPNDLKKQDGVANGGVPDKVVRQDSDFSSPTNNKGQAKSHLDENGDLVPANPDGNATVQQHVRGADPAKSDSPYTSTTSLDDVAGTKKHYGSEEIEIDTQKLQQDIDSGKLKDVEILPPKEVQRQLQDKVDEAQKRYEANPTPKNKDRLKATQNDLNNATRDGECLVKGCIPSEYIKGPN